MPPVLVTARGSVRSRTAIAATVVVLLTLSVSGWVLLATLESQLGRNEDAAARSRVDSLLGLAEAGRLPRTLTSVGDDGFAQVVGDGGRVLAATANVRSRPPVTTLRPAPGEHRMRIVRDIRDDRDLEDYRVWAGRGRVAGGAVTVYVATSVEVVAETVSTLRRLLLVGIPAVAVLLAALSWVILGRALRPVEAIRAEVAEISDAGLGRRVPEPAGDDEIARLARTMNAMLDRLAEASARQAAFTADASHELQGPLATFRTQLEVALARPRDADWPVAARELLAEAQSMERLVRDLLFLAREGQGDEQPGTLVDLDVVVLEEAVRVRATAAVAVVTTEVSGAPVRGSREQLSRLTRNLLENACRHATSQVQVRLQVVGRTVRLTVCDDGPGVPPAVRDQIFERFVRADPARSRDASGAGLGLSIVASVAARHGGSVQLAVSAPSGADRPVAGAAFVVTLPAAPDPD